METHHTEQAARGHLMWQLATRGYTVQFTDSRFPKEDLLVVSPSGIHFGVDVKGNKTKNFWQFKHIPPSPQLFIACLYVPPPIDNVCSARCFIIPSVDAMEMRRLHIEKANARQVDHGRWGINWGDAHTFENRYDLLPL